MQERPVEVRPLTTLGQALKLAGLADTGGQAKNLIVAGQVSVNGTVEYRRGRKLEDGDIVAVRDLRLRIIVRQ